MWTTTSGIWLMRCAKELLYSWVWVEFRQWRSISADVQKMINHLVEISSQVFICLIVLKPHSTVALLIGNKRFNQVYKIWELPVGDYREIQEVQRKYAWNGWTEGLYRQTSLTLDVTENQKLLTGRTKYAVNIRVTFWTIKKGEKIRACIRVTSRMKIFQLQGKKTLSSFQWHNNDWS